MDQVDFVIAARHLLLNYSLNVVPLVVLYYDYLLTLSDEINLFWPPRHALGFLSCALLITRYLAVLGYLPVVVAMYHGTISSGCGAVQTYHQYLQLVLQIPVALLCTMRVYALYAKDKRILLGFGILAVGLLVAAAVLITGTNPNSIQLFFRVSPVCSRMFTHNDVARFATAWSTLLIFDAAIFSLTVCRALRIWWAGRIVHILLRDGIVFFSALSLVNLSNILCIILAPPLLKLTLSTTTNVLSLTLISRLMFNLRSVHSESLPTESGGSRIPDVTRQSYTLDSCAVVPWSTDSHRLQGCLGIAENEDSLATASSH